jgi:inorganic pyrophosphatase
MFDNHFWDALDHLLASSEIVIDRPRGSAHPRYADLIYPLDYGYLVGTSSVDGAGIDVWLGALADRQLKAILCTVDRLKKDVEIKLLVGCTPDEIETAAQTHRSSGMACLLVKRG